LLRVRGKVQDLIGLEIHSMKPLQCLL